MWRMSRVRVEFGVGVRISDGMISMRKDMYGCAMLGSIEFAIPVLMLIRCYSLSVVSERRFFEHD